MKKLEQPKLFLKKKTITKLSSQQMCKINGGNDDDDKRTTKPSAREDCN